ncbi:MAG: hypothetical protein WCO66_00325 [Candidatus Absconditabacteria bacterium]
MAKPQKDRENKNKPKENGEKNFPKEKNDISGNVVKKITEALTEFNKEDKVELQERFGDGPFLEQLRKYFQEKYPSLLEEIESKEKLNIYVENLQNNGFTINNLVKNAKSFDESFKESDNEYNVTEKSLKKLKEYCKDEEDRLPPDIFNKFARFSKIDTTPVGIDSDSKIKKASDLKRERNKFLENEGIELKETQKDEMSKIMNPKYAPTTRLLVSASIKKLKKELPKELQDDFKKIFPLPLTITSTIQNLNDLKNQRLIFLQAHENKIDKDLAKKLDKIKVLNQDMYEEFENEGIAHKKERNFSEQEQEFRIVFNKLATRQLFDDLNKKNIIIEEQLKNVGEVFTGFPPYLNDVFSKYPYNENQIKTSDASFSSDIQKIDEKIQTLEESTKSLNTDEEKTPIFDKIKVFKKERNTRKWIAYAKHIATQNKELGNAIEKLVHNNFDTSKIEKGDQKIILNSLVTKKLEEISKNGTAEALGIDKDRFTDMMKDLFDMDKKEITIPSPNGDIIFDCPEKSFFGGPLIEGLELGAKGAILSDEDKKNLPLNLKLLLTEDNKDFFEKSPIFENLFQEFEDKNGTQTLNDGYLVRLKNNKGETVEGYLSNYAPNPDEGETTNKKQKNITRENERYLYSKPITRPEDKREGVLWKNEDMVSIKGSETKNYDIEILSRELNVNGKAIGGLLFGATVGQYSEENNIDPKQSKKLEASFDALEEKDIYKDYTKKIEETTKTNEDKEDKEKSDFAKFMKTWKSLSGYQTTEEPKENEENMYGFEKGAKLMIPYFESALYPNKGETPAFLGLEITKINRDKKIFTVKIMGGEGNLGGNEGKTVDLDLTEEGLKKIGSSFGNKEVYKLPKNTEENPNNLVDILEKANIESLAPSKYFKNIQRKTDKWNKQVGDSNENIQYFGKTEIAPGEVMDEKPTMETLCKVQYHPGRQRPYTVSISERNGKKTEKIKTEMDHTNFILFITSKGLSPKTTPEIEEQKKAADGPEANPPKKLPISISSISGFISSVSKKITENMKKYQEKQTEDFTEAIMIDGKLMTKLASIMPTDKLKDAFGKVGNEYLGQRDSKVWKKIEDRQNFYINDPDFGSEKLREAKIRPYLDGKLPFKDQRQAAGMLLATIQKGKGPYSRNTDWAGKGKWIKILFGAGHQQRYLNMKEKLQLELEQGININGQTWANNLQNEILKLEMKYITHVIDGRQLRNDDTPELEHRFSKKFASELETKSNEFFKGETDAAYGKAKDISSELARFEYFRLLADRPQQAIANLKIFAEKAVTKSQWKTFESMVLTGMLSGVFYSMTQEDKKRFIEEPCRTIGFLPGLLIRQPNHHHKIEKLLRFATGKKVMFGEKLDKSYDPNKFNFGGMESTNQIKDFVNRDKGFNKRYRENGDTVKKFVSLEGGNTNNKKLIEEYENPSTPNDIKQILGDLIDKSLEKNENLDKEVKENSKSLQQNILTRNQSTIDEVISFKDGSFKGKDKDEIQASIDTRIEIGKKIPKEKTENKGDIVYILKKFTNRFEGKGFGEEQKKHLVRLFKTVQAEKIKGNAKSADQILWYGIVGKIIKNSGTGQVPDELKKGIGAFKEFFENNIDSILTEEVISKGLGPNCLDSLQKDPFEVAPWAEYVKITQYRKGYQSDLSKEEKDDQTRKKRDYDLDNKYINKEIYDIAKRLEEGDYGVPNTLKEMYDPKKDVLSTKKQLEQTLSKNAIHLTNHEAVAKGLKKNTNIGTEPNEEEIAELEEEGYNY